MGPGTLDQRASFSGAPVWSIGRVYWDTHSWNSNENKTHVEEFTGKRGNQFPLTPHPLPNLMANSDCCYGRRQDMFPEALQIATKTSSRLLAQFYPPSNTKIKKSKNKQGQTERRPTPPPPPQQKIPPPPQKKKEEKKGETQRTKALRPRSEACALGLVMVTLNPTNSFSST